MVTFWLQIYIGGITATSNAKQYRREKNLCPYHQLKSLLAADLVVEDVENRGSYVIQAHRVQGIIMLLAGVSDMLDPEYTQGSWEE